MQGRMQLRQESRPFLRILEVLDGEGLAYQKYEDEVPKYLDMVFFYIMSLTGQGKEEEARYVFDQYEERFLDENYDLLLYEIAEDLGLQPQREVN